MNIAQIQVQVPATVQITLNTAIDTLQICDRQSRKDIGKVIRFSYNTYLVLSSPEAKKRYQIIWVIIMELAIIASMILKASWKTIQEWSETPMESNVVTAEAVSEDVAMPDTDPVPDEPTEETLSPVNNGSEVQDVETSAIVSSTPSATPSKPIFEMTRAEMLAMAQKSGIAGYRKMSNTRLQRKLQELATV